MRPSRRVYSQLIAAVSLDMLTLSTLPDDCVSVIVGQCDYADRLSVCLLARRFLEPGRIGLIRDVRVGKGASAPSLVKLLRREPDLAHHVRSVHIQWATLNVDAEGIEPVAELMDMVSPNVEEVMADGSSTCVLVVRAAAKRLVALRSLVLQCSGGHGEDDEVWTEMYAALRRHRGSLRRVALSMPFTAGVAAHPPLEPVAMPVLRTLDCPWIAGDAMPRWLTASAPDLRRLTCMSASPADALAVDVAARLSTLEIMALDIWIDLTRFHGLAKLRLLRIWDANVLRTLITLPQGLTELTVHGSPACLATILDSLRGQDGSAGLPNMTHLHWTVHCPRPGPAPATYAEELRAVCEARGIDCARSREYYESCASANGRALLTS